MNPLNLNDIAIFISSCDKYKHAWQIQRHCFDKYWSDCPFDVYFVTNFAKPPFGHHIITGPDKGWARTTLRALVKFPHPYLIFLLEDYWFNEPVNTKGLKELIWMIQTNHNIKHIRLYASKESKRIKRVSHSGYTETMNQDEPYRCSLNAGLWRTDYFRSMLEQVGEATIHECEHKFSQLSKDDLILTVKEMDFIKYDIDKNMVERGEFTGHAHEFIKKEEIKL